MTAPSLQLALKQRKVRDHENPQALHTFFLVFTNGRNDRFRCYRGPYSEAKHAAWRWLEEDPHILRILSEDGEIVAERNDR